MRTYTKAGLMKVYYPWSRITAPSWKTGVLIRYRATKRGPVHDFTAVGKRRLLTEAECIAEIKFCTAKRPIIVSQTLYLGARGLHDGV